MCHSNGEIVHFPQNTEQVLNLAPHPSDSWPSLDKVKVNNFVLQRYDASRVLPGDMLDETVGWFWVFWLEGFEKQSPSDASGRFESMSCCCLSCIDTGYIGVVQRFGEYVGLQQPGCSCVCFPCTTVRSVQVAVKQIQCQSDCKTKDNVTVSVLTAVQYRIITDMVKVAIFEISTPHAHIKAEVDSVLRSTLPTMSLDESYEAKEHMVANILETVRQAMGPYGYEIINVLITDIQPEPSVQHAMNEINAARRQREAAFEKGEAEKLLKIKAAEADAESKRLSGVGMASMRAAMAQGFQDSMRFMTDSGVSGKEAMHMMIMTQYLDTLKEFAGKHGSILVPHGPSAVRELESQVGRVGDSSSAVSQMKGQPKLCWAES